ncbi:hypothetical protein ACH4U7_39450 [Streptomyces sp. NPDC020845]|uniref:hypothetical protein n=1 Tax=Streptomyces sp. NPDC020845 TaxID=3365096 RepID=UPI003794F7E0
MALGSVTSSDPLKRVVTPDMRDNEPKFNLIENETYEDAVQRRVEAMDALGEYIPPSSYELFLKRRKRKPGSAV